ncbi:MAG: ABC transporter substrate-binding protein [Deltaproteobacteria bacterium]|jgi:NitT/TauT family transport system substrate-binding protein|nr:ABC transporter substrate-binding protein [Deltaproteobacteria bacterium]
MHKFIAFPLLFFLAAASAVSVAHAVELRICRQAGISYLPLLVIEEQKLLEKNAAAEGIKDFTVTWTELSGGAAVNEALLSGSVDLISGGVPPFLRLWDKTQGQVKIVAVLSGLPVVLTTARADIKSIADFAGKDKIAVPSLKVSLQSLLLQIAVAKLYGTENYDKLDDLTVQMKHADAYIALTSGRSEITAHFASEPFATRELRAGLHAVLNSHDLLGPTVSQVLSGNQKFYEKHPEIFRLVNRTVNEASRWIQANKKQAAELYLKVERSKEPLDLILAILENPQSSFLAEPEGAADYADFMYAIKAIKTKPGTWKDLYFQFPGQ